MTAISGSAAAVTGAASGIGRALALELAKREITVNCVAPGLIDTEMVSAEILEEAMKQIPLRRMGQPDEVATLICFLASEELTFSTGACFDISGGRATY